MSTDQRIPRLLGAAFLVQAIGSAVSGLVLPPIDLLANSAPADMTGAMADLAADEALTRASIVGEMITAFGVIALGALLYLVLRSQDRAVAIVALGLYWVEAAILAVREVFVFALLRLSQESGSDGGLSGDASTLGTLLYESQGFAYALHTLAFALGATMFYFLLFRSGYIPRLLAGWGLIAAPLALIAQTLVILKVDVPLLVFLPNLPFELAVGVWLVVKGIDGWSQDPASTRAQDPAQSASP